MKKFTSVLMACLLAVSFSYAQQSQSIPVDPNVRIGHLDNGLTYYIRYNAEPKGQANFYIAQKVGSILEDENQRGLAHFLEHMCFNGTANFPGNGVIEYCESIGVKFGADLNAYTSIDETVYNIDNVPVANVPSAIDSCLLILHDWADGLLLEADDIDHERGVIHEEWRGRMNATMRQYEKILPALYPDNKYGERLPIGLMEVVDNFPYQALRDYYEKWYRPDQQGIVVVGDIDVDMIEAKIKDIFGTIATPVDPAERYYVQIADNQTPIVTMATDPEQPYCQTYIFAKHDATPREMKSDMSYMIYSYAVNAIDMMLNARMQEMLQSPEPPFMMASVAAEEDYFIAPTKKAFTGIVVTSPEGFTKGVTALFREMLRAQRGGFTASEYERARADMLTHIESAYNQRDKRKSSDFCAEYVRHFIDNEPIPGIETEFALMNQIAPMIPVDVINQIVSQLNPEQNLAVACMLPQLEGVTYPSEDELREILAAVAAEEIEPYTEEISDEPLISALPAPGKVVKAEASQFGYRKYTLSNGATVYMKSTDYNADQILMRAVSKGGYTLLDAKDDVTIKSLDEIIGCGGLGNFSLTDLNKVLAGKKASVNFSVGPFTETVTGNTTPKDFETMLQLVYLSFTSRREDADAFQSWKTRTRAELQNLEVNPMVSFQDSVYTTFYNDSHWLTTLKAAQVDDVDYQLALRIADQRFADASDFSFIFTGNIDQTEALPLIEQYIGSLPSTYSKEKINAKALTFKTGAAVNDYSRKMEVPSATVVYFNHAAIKNSVKTQIAFDCAMQALTTILLSEIREKEGGTYSIQAAGDVSGSPRQEAIYQVVYQTSPETVDYLNERVDGILADFSANGPTPEGLTKAKEYLQKNYLENLRENSYWQGLMLDYTISGFDGFTGYAETLNNLTAKDVQKAFNAVYRKGQTRTLIMRGE